MSPENKVSEWCGARKKVRANQISMLNALWDVVLTSRGHFKGNLYSFSVSAARGPSGSSVSTGPELTLMKCLSSLEPLKRRSFKGINHLLSQGEGV